MSNKNTNRAGDCQSSVRDFLSGHGPNPIPENKRKKVGPLGTKFIREAMEDIVEQDRANERKTAPSVAEDLMAVMRLVSDNHDMIQLIQSRKFGSVSDLAVALGRELPNVSRTLSRMAAYGLIGYEEDGGDARTKKPVWRLSALSSHEDLDWVQVYCLAMALQGRTAIGLGDSNFSKIESTVRDAVASTAKKINLIKSPAHSR